MIFVFLLVLTSFRVFVNAIAVSNWSHYKLFAIEIMNFALHLLHLSLLCCFVSYTMDWFVQRKASSVPDVQNCGRLEVNDENCTS